METEQPNNLNIVKSEPIGFMGCKYYATDPQGNVWFSTEINGKPGEWRLYKKASELPPAALSFEQMVKLGSQQ